ncbi:hypothetical protein AABB24_015700 [Solanum stoloniferum]|uniref:Uncharacterized protein n=1 Tax=Solanum stoloniferum TaxID=62892 RepID=A0ABD2TRH1_9SOLN
MGENFESLQKKASVTYKDFFEMKIDQKRVHKSLRSSFGSVLFSERVHRNPRSRVLVGKARSRSVRSPIRCPHRGVDRFPKFDMVVEAPVLLKIWYTDLTMVHKRALNKYIGP